MEILKKKIIKEYVAITLVFMIVISVLDSIFDKVVDLLIANNLYDKYYYFAVIIYVLIHIVLFYLVAKLFFHRISKHINNEKNRSNKELNLLFANISHDIKTPLTSIVGYSNAIIDGKYKDETEKLEYIKIINKKGNRMNELLSLLISYTKLSSDNTSINRSPYDINVLLKNTLALNYKEIEDKNINLEVNIIEEKVIIEVDKTEFQRVFENLLSNAIKFSNNNSTLEILSEFDKNGKYKIYFKDQGTSLKGKNIEDLVNPFYRGELERNTRGYGLGLSITNAIIEKHGFKLELCNYSDGEYTKAFVIVF